MSTRTAPSTGPYGRGIRSREGRAALSTHLCAMMKDCMPIHGVRMNRLLVPLLPLLLAFGAGVPAYAQGDAWKTLNDEVESLYRQGQYDRAIVVAKKALDVAERTVGPDHPNVATSLNNLAALYQAQGQYAQAEPLYKRSLAIREKALGLGHLLVATSLNNLALLYKTQGQYAQAEPLFKRSLAIREKALGPNHPNVAQSLENLAELYKATNRPTEAEALKKRAEAIRAIKR